MKDKVYKKVINTSQELPESKANSVAILEARNSCLYCRKGFWAPNFFSFPYSNIQYYQAGMSIRGSGAQGPCTLEASECPFFSHCIVKQLKYLQISQALKANKDCNTWTFSKEKIQLVLTNQIIFKNLYS